MEEVFVNTFFIGALFQKFQWLLQLPDLIAIYTIGCL